MIARRLYTVCYLLLLPIIVVRLLWRSLKQPNYRQRILERFGFYSHRRVSPGGIWIHAVSVGEFLAAKPLIENLLTTYPERSIVLTTTTATGAAIAEQQLGKRITHVYWPYDLPWVIKRFLRFAKPALALLIETELWPNLIHICHQQAIPILLINARLSARSARGYARWSPLVRPMLAALTAIAAQNKTDARRFNCLGADKTKIEVTGSLKFDGILPNDLTEKATTLKLLWGNERRIWLAASTRQGEEEIILATYKTLKKLFPALLLVLVPRHPERCTAVNELCIAQGLSVIRRSQQQACPPTTDVFLGDTLGELLYFYAAAEIVTMGGSFVPCGGHNILEPAVMGIPVVMGPYMFNFAAIARGLCKAGGGIQVVAETALAPTLTTLLQDPVLRQSMGTKAKHFALAHRGALTKVMQLIRRILR